MEGSKKKNILLVYKTNHLVSFGGIESFIGSICNNINKDKFNFRVLSVSNNVNTTCHKKINGIEFISYKENFSISSNSFSINLLINYKNHTNWADLIHYNFPWPYGDFMHWILNIKKPYIVTYHSDIYRQKFLLIFYKPLMYYFLRNAKLIISSSKEYSSSSSILKRYKKIEIIPFGIDTPSINKSKIKKDKLLFKKNDYFIFVGVFRYYKNLFQLIKAFKGLEENLIIVGDGYLMPEIMKYIKSNKISNIKLAGEVNDDTKYKLISDCKAFILPSNKRSEAFGISLLEAAALKKPMITCDIKSGMASININNKTGFYFQSGDIDSLKAAVKKLNNNDTIKVLGNNSFNHFKKFFTLQKMINSYEKIYQRSYSS